MRSSVTAIYKRGENGSTRKMNESFVTVNRAANSAAGCCGWCRCSPDKVPPHTCCGCTSESARVILEKPLGHEARIGRRESGAIASARTTWKNGQHCPSLGSAPGLHEAGR